MCTINELTECITFEFNRIKAITKSNITIEFNIIDNKLHVLFKTDEAAGTVVVPIPIVWKEGIQIVKNGNVIRVVCKYWLEKDQEELDYYKIMSILFCEDPSIVMPACYGGSSMITRIVKSADRNQLIFMVNNLQRLINDIITHMPLHETKMNTWAMSHRLIIIDPEFEALQDPNDRLDYQVAKNEKYYEKGWTSIGLSDGVLADKNYILTTDLRKIIPFGMYHNPQRNLYSILGMKGDELPRVRSQSMQRLIDNGIHCGGWNLTTAIIDTPLNFEDQILVNKKLLNKLSHTLVRRFTIYNTEIMVEEGDTVAYKVVNSPY